MNVVVKKIVAILLIASVMFCVSLPHYSTTVEAKASKKAIKILKGEWRNYSSIPTIVRFTKKYAKYYGVKGEFPYKKGKLYYKVKIVSTKKKDGEWTIKLKDGIYYVGNKNYLQCYWNEDGEEMYSASDSLLKANEWKEFY